MATWMLYVMAAGAVLGLAAHLSERGLARLDRPARWPWLAAMVATSVWPLARAAAPGGGPSSLAGAGEVVGPVPAGVAAGGWRLVTHDLPAVVPDAALVLGWLAASTLGVGFLVAGAAVLRRHQRGWRSAVVSGERVLLSADVGPAVVGALRPRIVLPAWVLELDESLQRLIVLHEREHVRAGDGRALAAGLFLLVLLPWCLPLWWQFHRLRFAVETDCDRRLLRGGVAARPYAEALLAVARRRPSLLPLAAMSPTKSTLERRIRFIVRRPPRRDVRRALLPLTTAALAVLLGSAAAPAPPPAGAAVGALFGGGQLSPARAEQAPEPLPDGSLPGQPPEEALIAAIAAHHPGAVANGIPSGAIVWVVADGAGAVRRTGIERGSEADVAARIRARYPDETSDFLLAFDGVPAGSGAAHVLWMLPAPPF